MKIGLVSFSTGPDVLVMPTTDRGVLQEGVDLLSPEAGTAIGDGLGVAVQVVKSSVADAPRGKDGKLPGAIVLLSDGAQTRGVLTPMQGAALARNAGIRVFTVVLGTDHGTLGVRVRSAATASAAASERPAAVPGAARSGHARRDRARDRRPDVPRDHREPGRLDLQAARPRALPTTTRPARCRRGSRASRRCS